MADSLIILGTALKVAVTGIILAHNQPSENLKPFKVDELLANKIKQGPQFRDIQFADHLILTSIDG